MVNNILDSVVACSNVFGSYARIRLQKRHVVATVGGGIPVEVEYGLSMRHGNREGDGIR